MSAGSWESVGIHEDRYLTLRDEGRRRGWPSLSPAAVDDDARSRLEGASAGAVRRAAIRHQDVVRMEPRAANHLGDGRRLVLRRDEDGDAASLGHGLRSFTSSVGERTG